MFAFILRRILQAVVVMLVISLAVFAIKNQFGDPVRDLVGERVTPEEREQIAEKMKPASRTLQPSSNQGPYAKLYKQYSQSLPQK